MLFSRGCPAWTRRRSPGHLAELGLQLRNSMRLPPSHCSATTLRCMPPNTHGDQPAVVVKNLDKRYGSLWRSTTGPFPFAKAEIFGIIGPNGAGKTTTVECISGLRVPDSGSISVYGLSPQHDRDRIREFVGVQLQESALPPHLRVGEALNCLPPSMRVR